MKPKPSYVCSADLFATWRDDLLSGKAPVFYPVGTGDLGRIEIGPGLVTLIGGAPGSGKTAFTMQCVVDALRMTPTLRAVVCNIEMPPAVLMDRQLARLAGIDARIIRYRKLGAEHADRIDQALNTLEPLAASGQRSPRRTALIVARETWYRLASSRDGASQVRMCRTFISSSLVSRARARLMAAALRFGVENSPLRPCSFGASLRAISTICSTATQRELQHIERKMCPSGMPPGIFSDHST